MINFKRMENIHLSDEQLYDLIKQNFRDGFYESAINLMETNPQLDEKILGQIAYNSMQNNLKHLQEQNDPDFKKDLIPLSYNKPQYLPINKIWFKITKEEKAVEKKTYAELLTLKQNNQLEVGSIYLLTDYVTKYQQPVSNTMKVGKYDLATATPEQIQEETEPLLLQAISKSEFAVECYSFKFPEDIIYYDFNNSVCEDGLTPRNGFILRRYWVKNEVNVPFDWQHIVWARWINPDKFNLLSFEQHSGTNKQEFYTFSKADGSNKGRSNSFRNIKILGNSDYGNLKLLNTVFYGDRYNDNITAGHDFVNNTLGDDCCYLTFGNYCHSNTFGSRCRNSIFGDNCYKNTFNDDSGSNSFGSSCFSNTFDSNCSGNTFGSNCSDNTFGSSCSRNSFGSSCYANVMLGRCSNNIFPNSCRNLRIKILNSKNLTNISDLQNSSKIINIETHTTSNGGTFHCYWYMNGTNYSDIKITQIP